jgi:hypothetical protein
MRKRMQIDNYNELPQEKRPVDDLIWNAAPEELENWLDKVLKNEPTQSTFEINPKEIE